MTTDQIVVAVISAVLGGGLFSGAAAVWQARQASKKVPADLNSTSIGSAERALMMLKIALDEAEERIVELKAERDELKEELRTSSADHRIEIENKIQRIKELEDELRTLRDELNNMRITVNTLWREANEATQGE